jgi:hypothetical protein
MWRDYDDVLIDLIIRESIVKRQQPNVTVSIVAQFKLVLNCMRCCWADRELRMEGDSI